MIRPKFSGFLLLLGLCPALAQDPAPVGGNAARNGDFEQTYDEANLWTGVNPDGVLAAPIFHMPVLNESGSIANAAMPPGVSIADLNGDQLPDLLCTDAYGYVRIYFNKGSAQEPKFEYAELSLPFLGLPEGAPLWTPPELSTTGQNELGQWLDRWAHRRRALRGSLADASGDGLPDLVAGNYFGEILLVRNEGTPTNPAFRQPQPLSSAIVPTTKEPQRRWGNVFSPLLADWTKDGQPDLLVGEGSYSANNIHLFINQGSGGGPVFNEGKKQALALGEGREQLAPALADINSDGNADILVSDRAGRVAVHLNKGDWKFDPVSPVAVPFTGYLKKGGGFSANPGEALVLGEGTTTLAAGDLNGDELIDLAAGRSNGRLVWVRNEGTKQEPKFGDPAELRGNSPAPKNWRLPSQWDAFAGEKRGNFYGFASCVDSAEDAGGTPTSGSRAFKFGYFPSPNQVVARPVTVMPAEKGFNILSTDYGEDSLLRDSSESRARGGPSNLFVLRQISAKLQIGKTYVLSFDAKGSKASNARILLAWRGFKQLGEDRITRGERGSVQKDRNVLSETRMESANFSVGGSWAQISKEFTIDFKKSKDLNKEKETSEATLEISCEIAPPDGALYIDNLKLMPKP
jgi:hypothetical protein